LLGFVEPAEPDELEPPDEDELEPLEDGGE